MSVQAKSKYSADDERLKSVSEQPKKLQYCVNGEWLIWTATTHPRAT